MAIDTRAKRASVLGTALPFRQHLPIPDGTIEAPDRAHLNGLYAGITLAEEAALWTPVTGISSTWSDVSGQASTWSDVAGISTVWA